ncbi:hypothetical protein DdX_12105 [Ditylenchus destructor]|uniref:Uncharacterized protein n=1 Tax=Ditylenchus destructor TaxID=166010 RepID=A0AAD4MYF6_9BILA|nr:hypothetical protein DdX_12105 [Ditylenchus destructor]
MAEFAAWILWKWMARPDTAVGQTLCPNREAKGDTSTVAKKRSLSAADCFPASLVSTEAEVSLHTVRPSNRYPVGRNQKEEATYGGEHK